MLTITHLEHGVTHCICTQLIRSQHVNSELNGTSTRPFSELGSTLQSPRVTNAEQIDTGGSEPAVRVGKGKKHRTDGTSISWPGSRGNCESLESAWLPLGSGVSVNARCVVIPVQPGNTGPFRGIQGFIRLPVQGVCLSM